MGRARQLLTLLSGGGVSELDALLAKFPTGQYGGIYRNSSTQYIMACHIVDDLCAGYLFEHSSFTADQNAIKLTGPYIYEAMTMVNEVGRLSGAGWSTSAGSTYWGGSYSFCDVPGSYFEFTTPSGATKVGGNNLASTSSGGMMRVTLNGDATLANALPTAQDLVDGGSLASSALVANGGTLNPTDRIWDCYNNTAASPFQRKLFASGLTPAIYTVRVTITGYQNVSASNVRLHIQGGWHDVVEEGSTSTVLRTVSAWADPISRVEFAFQYDPSGGSATYEWIGHTNSEKTIDAQIYNGASPVTLNTYESIWGANVTLVTNVYCIHADTGATHVLESERIYHPGPDGIRISYTLEWLVAGTVAPGYPSMMPLPTAFDRASRVGAGEDITLSANDGSFRVAGQSTALYAWQLSGNYAAMLYINDLATVNNWADVTSTLAIEDRSGGTLEKIYARRTSSALVAVNDVWQSDTTLRFAYFPEGAETALAR